MFDTQISKTDFAHASVDVRGRLPKGDPRAWAQTLTDVVCSVIDRDLLGRIKTADDQALTSADLAAQARTLDDHGIVAGSTVIVESANTLTGTAVLLALWQRGAVVCPIDSVLTASTRALIIESSGAQAIIDQQGAVTRLHDGAPERVIKLRRPLRVTGADLALMVFTSGSTGKPKGVMLSHRNVMSALRAIAAYQGLDQDDRIVAIPPFFFDYGLYQLFLALFSGAELILTQNTKIVSKLAPMIARVQPTVLPGVPALSAGIAQVLSIMKKTVPSVRLITNTGGHLAEATMDDLQRICPNATLMPMYGLTECKRAMYCNRDTHPDAADSVGGAMPGLAALIAIEDEDGLRPCADGETGELFVRGSSVMQGYRGDATSAGARLYPGRYRDDMWLATGDLFLRDASGQHYFRGRSKSLIKQAGFCLIPRDLEALAEQVDIIGTAIVVGRQESSGDESAVMFVMPSQDLGDGAEKQIKAALKDVLTPSAMPRIVRVVSDWPSTPNGKICLKMLAQWAEDL